MEICTVHNYCGYLIVKQMTVWPRWRWGAYIMHDRYFWHKSCQGQRVYSHLFDLTLFHVCIVRKVRICNVKGQNTRHNIIHVHNVVSVESCCRKNNSHMLCRGEYSCYWRDIKLFELRAYRDSDNSRIPFSIGCDRKESIKNSDILII